MTQTIYIATVGTGTAGPDSFVANGILKGICPVHETKHQKFLFRRQSGQFHFIPNGGWIFSEPQVLSKKFIPTRWNSVFESFSLPDVQEFNVINDTYPPGKLKKTLVIDLKKSPDEIWQQDIHSKRRNMIRKAIKEGIFIRQVRTEEELTDFYSLYAEASNRYSNNRLSFQFFREMLFDSQNIELDLYVAWQDKKQLASAGIISDKNYSIYWLGNNAKDVKNKGQGELLQWHAIQKMKEKGCNYYDLCYIEPNRLPSIYKFKKGFSKTEKNINLIIKKPVSFKILNRLSKIMSLF